MKLKSKHLFFIKKSLVAILATTLLTNFANADEKLNDDLYDKFILGKSFFRIPWVEAPSATTARDGLGPLFNANTCISCHPNNQKGILFNKNKNLSRSLITKLSIKSDESKEQKEALQKDGFVAEPNYGGQIAINAIHGVNFEAKTKLEFEKIQIIFPDGEIDELLKPKFTLENLQYGELHKNTNLTFRLAPTLNGIGYINAIKDEDILKNQDEFDENKDGISGRANYVYSPITKKLELGKFSYKASIATLKEQIANAASNDMGLTTTLYANENCTKTQKLCNEAPKAKDAIDITDERLDAIEFYLKNIKTVQNKNFNQSQGYKIFKTIGCNNCHIESFTTKKGKTIYPFSDFLLHDMGEDLKDEVSQFQAEGNEWRTTPLWGLSLYEKLNKGGARLLHDGRARDFQEAILWHGGEALKSKKSYMNLRKKDRALLLKFLQEV